MSHSSPTADSNCVRACVRACVRSWELGGGTVFQPMSALSIFCFFSVSSFCAAMVFLPSTVLLIAFTSCVPSICFCTVTNRLKVPVKGWGC